VEFDPELAEIRDQFFILEDDFDSDSDSDLTELESVSDSDLDERELDEDEEEEIRDNIALLTFSNFLQQAQQTAIKAERKKWGERKRPKRYTKNSARSLRHHAEKRQKLAREGQKFIPNWFHTKDKSSSPMTHNPPIEIEKVRPEPVSNNMISSQKMLLTHFKSPFEELREEEEESKEESEKKLNSETESAASSPGITMEHRQQVEELLAEIRRGQCPQSVNDMHRSASDNALNALNYKDFLAL
jgi:hypothetical protein